MKIFSIPNEKIPRILYIVLLSIAGALIVLLLIGTIVGLARPRNAAPVLTFGSPGQAGISAHTDDMRVFSGLGRLRIPLLNQSTLLLTIAFPYSARDVAFTEELAAKISDFRVIATGYFSALPAESVIQIDEETAKQEILKRFNASLRLGRIESLYFSDMMIIDANF